MGDTQYLAGFAKGPKLLAHDFGNTTAYAHIDLIIDEAGDAADSSGDDLDCQADT